jgi:hypothetical protein
MGDRNRNEAGRELIGFADVVAVHAQNIEKFKDRPSTASPPGSSDLS